MLASLHTTSVQPFIHPTNHPSIIHQSFHTNIQQPTNHLSIHPYNCPTNHPLIHPSILPQNYVCIIHSSVVCECVSKRMKTLFQSLCTPPPPPKCSLNIYTLPRCLQTTLTVHFQNDAAIVFWNCRWIGGPFQMLSQTNICLESQVKHQTRVH